jgi:hypothetical protein
VAKTAEELEEEENLRAEEEQQAAIARRKRLKDEALKKKREEQGETDNRHTATGWNDRWPFLFYGRQLRPCHHR